MTRKVEIALVKGDGSGPEMMAQATKVASSAAKIDGIEIEFVPTPMGWCAYKEHSDTLPKESFEVATKLGILFFGGVGDPQYDNTIGKEHPEMMPEPRTLLTIRKAWGLLLNFRPIIYYPQLKHLAKIRSDLIPDYVVEQVFIRFLLQDSYFGSNDLRGEIGEYQCWKLGIIPKSEVSGNEEKVVDVAYYRRETVIKYLEAAFTYAQQKGLPIISIDKANVMPRYQFWRILSAQVGKLAFPDVELRHQLVDSANALLFTPAELHGVIACGNEHGDILSDGAATAMGSLGMMCSSAINPDTGQAMFESGAGTAPTLAGKDKANPLGRILTAAMMLRHIGAQNGANAIEAAVKKTLEDGWRTAELAEKEADPKKILGTVAMGEKVLSYLEG